MRLLISLVCLFLYWTSRVESQERNGYSPPPTGYERSENYSLWARRTFTLRDASPQECADRCSELGERRCNSFEYNKKHRACFGRRQGQEMFDRDSQDQSPRRYLIRYDNKYDTYVKIGGYYRPRVHRNRNRPRTQRKYKQTTTTLPTTTTTTSRSTTSRNARVNTTPRYPYRFSTRHFNYPSTTRSETTRRTLPFLRRTRPQTTTQRPYTRRTRPQTTERAYLRRTRPQRTTTTERPYTRRTRPQTTTTTTTQRRTRPQRPTTTERPYTRRTRPQVTTTTERPYTRRTRPQRTTTTERPYTRRTRPQTTTTERPYTRRTRPQTTTTTTTQRRTRPQRPTTTERPYTRRTRPQIATTTERPYTRRTRPQTTTTTTTQRTRFNDRGQDCEVVPAGIENGQIGNNALTSSSSYLFNSPYKARLNGNSAWVASSNNLDQYLQINLGETKRVSGLAVQGTSNWYGAQQYVTSYKIEYKRSFDDAEFTPYTDRFGVSEIRGAQDKDEAVRYNFDPSFDARMVRIVPLSWQGAIAMRVEIYVQDC